MGGLAFDLGGGRRLLLETDYRRNSTNNAYWGTPLVNGRIDPALRHANYNISPENQYLDSVWWTRAALDYGLGGWQARTQLYFYRADGNRRNFAPPRYNTATGPGAPFAPSVTVREVEDLVYDNDQLRLRHEMRSEGSLRTMRYRLVAGLDLSRSSFESSRFQAGPTNAIAVDPLDPGRPRLLVGEQSAQGAEVAGAWRISRAIAVFGNLASVDARYDRLVSGGVNVAGNRPRKVPKLVATAGLSVRPMPSLALSGLARRVGDNPLNDTNTVFLPARTVGDLFACYRVSRDLEVTAAVRNVADRVYADWGIQFLGTQGANFAPPRTFELSLRARF
ncbi:MAG: TonB-dependent receptor domain-containing protein [bacterium]|nr:TonB-dependent receptor [Betaproteobacteria bacterium]